MEYPSCHSVILVLTTPINGIISDLDGVAYRDDHPIPGVGSGVSRLA